MSSQVNSIIKKVTFLLILGAVYYWFYHEPVRDSSGLIIELGIISPLDLFSGDCYEEDKYISTDDVYQDQVDVTKAHLSRFMHQLRK